MGFSSESVQNNDFKNFIDYLASLLEKYSD